MPADPVVSDVKNTPVNNGRYTAEEGKKNKVGGELLEEWDIGNKILQKRVVLHLCIIDHTDILLHSVPNTPHDVNVQVHEHN
ncbi:hypothetical protein A3B21_00230 [Candidatus Uhrbacteria bacterium RIFCSPLOWO2_01_FULL_47_24]|uniref:Uncharacterized protein n=1 Tax=Candidatus Uhrbacteria bacterium RIFCSPLOWO2_01_FULL_47_24 TaxID=1802401 RepID=A0A1F7UUF0_9BACT|nr:MAG: hypothetical protein A2753_03860 [Candidatus Uhrbacteria bacterium RIFCSPHIGHO2_01_FULL_47_11]OGL68024.1 MAG: hypothetical protein A3D58_01605 [Candidatus Uhrbacteria bacterium RIFCSPHIGHO2_02_FULL_46_47]OGL75434.1 MAG: hypothetical protein A3F52_04950 [Candidatus Uhrbacteria bacterium RIFCSPHIGHO2_12_FULL_47_11]OGL81338.1 MAG: hypothetical protein A3B21_00230 [Candidatus Uhrbacteria bacterium RIFCSPLOWO2_01_FULL_47_24]